MDDLLPEFLAETKEALVDLEFALVKLERDPDDTSTLALIFRLVHTIKGTCGFLARPRLEHVVHAAENVLDRVRNGELAATPAVVSIVLAAVDRIKAILEQLCATGRGRGGEARAQPPVMRDAEPPGDDQRLILALDRLASGAPKPAPGPPQLPPARQPAGADPAPREPEKVRPPSAAPAGLPDLQASTAAQTTPAASAVQQTQTIRVAVDVLEA